MPSSFLEAAWQQAHGAHTPIHKQHAPAPSHRPSSNRTARPSSPAAATLPTCPLCGPAPASSSINSPLPYQPVSDPHPHTPRPPPAPTCFVVQHQPLDHLAVVDRGARLAHHLCTCGAGSRGCDGIPGDRGGGYRLGTGRSQANKQTTNHAWGFEGLWHGQAAPGNSAPSSPTSVSTHAHDIHTETHTCTSPAHLDILQVEEVGAPTRMTSSPPPTPPSHPPPPTLTSFRSRRSGRCGSRIFSRQSTAMGDSRLRAE